MYLEIQFHLCFCFCKPFTAHLFCLLMFTFISSECIQRGDLVPFYSTD